MIKMTGSVLDRIRALLVDLSPKQRKLAEYILVNYKKAAFMTSTVLGSEAKVSESTVIRLSTTLGYSGFPDLQSSLQDLIQYELTTIDRFADPVKPADNTLYSKVFSEEAHNILKVLASISSEQFNKATDLLYNQRRVVVVGHQASACLASYAGYSLSKVRSDVFTLNKWDETAFAIVSDLGPNDVAWINVFPRYPNQTVHLAKLLQEHNVPILLITNSSKSPLKECATVLLPVQIRYDAFSDGLASVMCLINALVLETALRNKANTIEHLKRFEDFVVSTNIFQT